MTTQTGPALTRRNALKMAAGVTGGLITAATFGHHMAFAQDNEDATKTAPSTAAQQQIESILQAQGKVSHGVLSIAIPRRDIDNVQLHGTPFSPSFQINGTVVCQKADNGNIMMNADMCLKADELQPFISALIRHNLVFQAEHQHFYNLDPLVWFIHFRGMADPQTLARSIKAALNTTSTPFPIKSPPGPTTPLPAGQIGRIIGAKPSVTSGGVVMLQVPRAEPIMLGGMRVNPYLNVETPIAFEPLPGGKAAAVCDYGMVAREISAVVGLMQQQGWESGCLYNQETDEQPHLYFDHMFKVGDALQLAREIRSGLNKMNVKLM
jgi:hypothetical protein